MASSFEAEPRATEVGAEKLSAFERLLQKYDIAHDFSPSVSPEQAKEIRKARRALFIDEEGGDGVEDTTSRCAHDGLRQDWDFGSSHLGTSSPNKLTATETWEITDEVQPRASFRLLFEGEGEGVSAPCCGGSLEDAIDEVRWALRAEEDGSAPEQLCDGAAPAGLEDSPPAAPYESETATVDAVEAAEALLRELTSRRTAKQASTGCLVDDAAAEQEPAPSMAAAVATAEALLGDLGGGVGAHATDPRGLAAAASPQGVLFEKVAQEKPRCVKDERAQSARTRAREEARRRGTCTVCAGAAARWRAAAVARKTRRDTGQAALKAAASRLLWRALRSLRREADATRAQNTRGLEWRGAKEAAWRQRVVPGMLQSWREEVRHAREVDAARARAAERAERLQRLVAGIRATPAPVPTPPSAPKPPPAPSAAPRETRRISHARAPPAERRRSPSVSSQQRPDGGTPGGAPARPASEDGAPRVAAPVERRAPAWVAAMEAREAERRERRAAHQERVAAKEREREEAEQERKLAEEAAARAAREEEAQRLRVARREVQAEALRREHAKRLEEEKCTLAALHYARARLWYSGVAAWRTNILQRAAALAETRRRGLLHRMLRALRRAARTTAALGAAAAAVCVRIADSDARRRRLAFSWGAWCGRARLREAVVQARLRYQHALLVYGTLHEWCGAARAAVAERLTAELEQKRRAQELHTRSLLRRMLERLREGVAEGHRERERESLREQLRGKAREVLQLAQRERQAAARGASIEQLAAVARLRVTAAAAGGGGTLGLGGGRVAQAGEGPAPGTLDDREL